MNGLLFLLCCTEILGFGALQPSANRTESNNSSSTTTPLTSKIGFSTNMTETRTTISTTRSTPKVISKSPSTSPPPVITSTLFHSIFSNKDWLPYLMVTGGLMIVCTILLVSTLLLACKVCHLARRLKGLSSNSDLIDNSEYWMGTDKKGKSKSEAEPAENTVLMADINETPAEMGNGTKEEGGKVTEEGPVGEENTKEVGDVANGEEASAEPVADAEKSSPSKPQEEATDSQITKAGTASTSEGTEEPKDVV